VSFFIFVPPYGIRIKERGLEIKEKFRRSRNFVARPTLLLISIQGIGYRRQNITESGYQGEYGIGKSSKK